MGAFIAWPRRWTQSSAKAKRKEALQPPTPCVLSGDQRTLRTVLANSFVKFLPVLKCVAVLGLAGCISAHAADKPFKPSEAKTSKPDLLGQTRTELRDSRGQKVGEAVTTKPNLLGDTRTTLRDTSGKTLGEAVTRKHLQGRPRHHNRPGRDHQAQFAGPDQDPLQGPQRSHSGRSGDHQAQFAGRDPHFDPRRYALESGYHLWKIHNNVAFHQQAVRIVRGWACPRCQKETGRMGQKPKQISSCPQDGQKTA